MGLDDLVVASVTFCISLLLRRFRRDARRLIWLIRVVQIWVPACRGLTYHVRIIDMVLMLVMDLGGKYAYWLVWNVMVPFGLFFLRVGSLDELSTGDVIQGPSDVPRRAREEA